MFWNLCSMDENQDGQYLYVGLRQAQAKAFVCDPAWMLEHSRHSRYGAKFFTSEDKKALQTLWGDLPEGFQFVCGSMRFKDALEIDQGACNLTPISYALHTATKEVIDVQQGSSDKDPAVRLIVHQMAHLCGFGTLWDMDEYLKAKEYCLDMCNAGGVKVHGMN